MTSSDAGEAFGPVKAGERIRALDMLRGWAMFGVLWSNLNDNYGTSDPATALDRLLAWTQTWLIESRFYSLLILLFGIGFGMQLTRARVSGTDLRNIYYRRTAALLAIGILHGTLIWRGDILTIYALVAFALVMFRTASKRQLLVAAALLYFIGPVVVREARMFAGLRVMMPDTSGETIAVYAHGSWSQIEAVRLSAYLQWLGRWGLAAYPSILAFFLVGLWSVRSGYLQRIISEPRSTRRLLTVALLAAAIGYSLPFWLDSVWPPYQPAHPDAYPAFPFVGFQHAMVRSTVLSTVNWATEGSAVAFACILLLLWQWPLGARALQPLAATGQMALTTYLTQSVVCTLLFYSYGLGWYGSVGFTGMLLITLTLFSGQMALSTWWLARFRYGPVEWVWRAITYARAPAMRRSRSASVVPVPS